MKLYKDDLVITADKEQVSTMVENGWSLTKPEVEVPEEAEVSEEEEVEKKVKVEKKAEAPKKIKRKL